MAKLVKVQIELIVDSNTPMFDPCTNIDRVCEYLTDKLYTDPEFYGEFGPENIISVEDYDNE